jgi:putative DNA primase/helicase
VLQSVQRIYDADVDPRKKTMKPVSTIKGAAVRLFEHRDELGVAEGVETAIACREMLGIPVWSALSAGGIECFEPPPDVKRLIIFADNDRNGRGQLAAYRLLNKLSSKIEEIDVRIPTAPGTDWLDVLNAELA